MGTGVGVLLLAVGAILTFAINVSTSGFNLHTIGIILMIIGGIGIILDLVLFMPRRRMRSRRVVEDPAYGPTSRARVYEDREVY
jgi:beta-lactamase regulating signal transducer with metallopeptidase domain